MASISPITSNHSVASSPDVNRSLKEALYETLNGILSPHHDIRIAAEERIQALEVTEGTEWHQYVTVARYNLTLSVTVLVKFHIRYRRYCTSTFNLQL
jgi:hypothetical protein